MPLSQLLIIYLIQTLIVFLPSFGFAKLFQKAGVPAWKAYIPFYNTWVIQEINQRPKHWVFWQFIPVVGWFISPGIFIEFAKVFGKFSFVEHTLAAILAPFYFPYIAYKPGTKFIGAEQVRKHKKSATREWIDAAIFAIIAATLIRTFIFEAYTIPTGSMEKTLLVNDFLFVSKFSYGPRIPMTPLSIPFVHNYIPGTHLKSYTQIIKLPYIRWFESPVQRRDVVVFNFPAGDTVINLDDYQSKDPYYEVARRLGNGNMEAGRKIILSNPGQYPLAIHPVDKTDNYIKRCVAIAGDSLQVKAGQVYVNGTMSEPPPKAQYTYSFLTKTDLNDQFMKDEFDVRENEYGKDFNNRYHMLLAYDMVDKFSKQPFLNGPLESDNEKYEPRAVNDFTSGLSSGKIFPHDTIHRWTVDNYGPLWVPKKGVALKLTPENYSIYERAIRVYENNDFYMKDNRFFLNGKEVNDYTFKMNYYWMMGDNRHQSQDSRYWGFVPEDHVVGKAWLIWFSWEDGPRWNRLFKVVK
jgi:signal peptidase I